MNFNEGVIVNFSFTLFVEKTQSTSPNHPIWYPSLKHLTDEVTLLWVSEHCAGNITYMQFAVQHNSECVAVGNIEAKSSNWQK